MVIVPDAADRLAHLLLALLSGVHPGCPRLLEGATRGDVTLELRGASRPPRALLKGGAPRDPPLRLLACLVEVGVGVAELRTEGKAGRLAEVVLDVKEVRAVVDPQAVAGVGQEPFGFVAGDLYDLDRQAFQGRGQLGGPGRRVAPLAVDLQEDEVADRF